MGLLADAYLWVKAFHMIAVISWMAGMLYLPRLFVYHCDAAVGSSESDTFKVMEQRLLRVITTPAMIVAWVFGLLLAITPGIISMPGSGWFHAKLLFVLVLTGVHGFLAKTVRDFAEDKNKRPGRFYRILNEIPTVLMICIVLLVVLKPF